MPDLTAASHERIQRDGDLLDITRIHGYLQDHLGERMVTYLVGLGEARTAATSSSTALASKGVEDQRLRGGYKAVRMIVEAYDATTARAWLFGTNPQLDDEAPIEVIGRASEKIDIGAFVRAAQDFAAAR